MSGELGLFLLCLVPFRRAPVMVIVLEATGNGVGGGLFILGGCNLGSEGVRGIPSGVSLVCARIRRCSFYTRTGLDLPGGNVRCLKYT